MTSTHINIPSRTNLSDEEYFDRYISEINEAEAAELRDFEGWLENFFNWFPEYRLAHDGFTESLEKTGKSRLPLARSF